ncbi:hypothetical protein OG401_21090 [Kitasatospora purpeofusca]|uniref:hypothetical protein n=1 Tax=Kitasatospora purpeofusca TaxID=67352 RepID=UPI00225741D5|nr:hypothetical protein [Kitasatospora purpeofusca]MCX4686777.1 hypothetical protein [Kitasatospora purpeofusca]
MTTTPTPRVLDTRRSAATRPATTAAVLLAYRTELIDGGVPAALADELVMAAGRTVVHTNGLTASTSSGITVSLAPAGSGTCRCARGHSAGGSA